MIAQATVSVSEEDSSRSTLTAAVAFNALNRLVQDMQDGLDHPELWPLLRDVVEAGEHASLLVLLQELRPLQQPGVGKIFDTIAAVVRSLGGNSADGLAILKRLEALDGLCPQVAGALFYVTHVAKGDRPPNLEAKFCAAPFEKFETLVDGSVAPCCSIWTQKRLGRLEEQTFDQIWNGRDAREMRASILDGSFRYCNKQRCTHIVENTLPDRASLTDVRLRTIIDRGDVALEDRPRWLFLAHDWTCNLACPSCRNGLLSANEDQERRFAIVEHEVLYPILEAKEEVLVSISGQGDPWSSQHYRSLLRYLADHDLNVRLEIHTNALLMGPQRWQQFSGLEKYRCTINVSIDACTPWVYEVVRFPGIWERLEPNLKFIAEKRRSGVFREFHLNATVQLDNYHEIGDMIDYARDIGAESMRLYLIQNTGGHLSRDYARKNIADPDHPLHMALLETLRDSRLGTQTAHLYDIKALRDLSFSTQLPSDSGRVANMETAVREMVRASKDEKFEVCVALGAAARAKFGSRADILGLEADALDRLGFQRQAGYRRRAAAVVCGHYVAETRLR